MIGSKRMNMVVATAMVFALLAVFALYALGSAAQAGGILDTDPAYATQIFGTDIISVEILADEDDWQEMLDNAASEQFIMADVIVNGTRFQNVGVRPKGNSSLTQVAQSDSDRYSLRLQFDEYISDQTCFGLQSFVLNNMMGDYTYMREYISYDMMQEAGVQGPYFGFADVKLNGKAWGLYLAVELYNESYEQRAFGTTAGMLYNVKSMDMGGNDDDNQAALPEGFGQRGGMPQMPGGIQAPAVDAAAPSGIGAQGDGAASADGQSDEQSQPAAPDNGQTAQAGESRGSPMGGMGGRGNTGGSLAYNGEDSSSYSAIFGNVVGKGTEKDYQRVIEALKALSEGRDLETYFDVDQILRYFAAHTFVVNLDSYSSSMAQNYYLYELNGQITMLPWDYNLAWGGFQSGDASSVVNFPIDTPVSGLDMADRPMLDKLLSNAAYLEAYHSYLQQLVNGYFSEGKFEAKIRELDALIGEYVKNDPTAFCTYAQYQAAVETFITLGDLRAESVEGQLNGTVPGATAAQEAEPDKLISTEGLSLSSLGSMMGGGRGGDANGFPGMGGQGENGTDTNASGDTMRRAMELLQQSGGELTEEVQAELAALGLSEEQMQQLSSFSGRSRGDGQSEDRQSPGAMPAGQGGSAPNVSGNNFLLATAVGTGCLALATVVVARRKRRY